MQIIFNLFILYLLIHFTFKWNNKIIHQLTDAKEFQYINHILFFGLTVKLSVISAWYIVAGGHEFNLSVSDASWYDSIGNYIGESFRHFVLPNLLDYEKVGFAYVVGILYAIFGNHHIVVSFFNAMLSVWAAMMIFEITYTMSRNHRASIYAYIAAMFYPHFISASYLLLKDMMATFLLVAVVWSVYCLNNMRKRLLFLAFMIFILGYIRVQMAVVIVVLLVIHVMLNRNLIFQELKIYNKFISNFILLSFIITGVLAFYNMDVGGMLVKETGYTLPTVDQGGLMENEDVRIMSIGTGTGNVLADIASHPILFIKSLMESFIRIFFGPFFLYAAEGINLTPYAPDEVGFRAVLESLGGLYTGLMLPFIIWGFLYFIKNHRWDLLIWGFPVLWIISMTLAGVIIRWRLPMIALSFIFWGIGFQFSEKIKRLYPLYFILLIFILAFNASRLEGFVLVGGICAAMVAVIIQLLILQYRSKENISR